jgi:hypothetical protein
MDQASWRLEYAQGFKGLLVADGMQSRPPPKSSQDGIQMSPPEIGVPHHTQSKSLPVAQINPSIQ